MVPFRLAKMKDAGLPLTWKDEVLLKTWPVGPWGPDAVVGMLTVRGHLADARGRHRVEGAGVGPLIRDPEGARGAEGDAPRVDQVGVGDLGETRDVGDQVRLEVRVWCWKGPPALPGPRSAGGRDVPPDRAPRERRDCFLGAMRVIVRPYMGCSFVDE